MSLHSDTLSWFKANQSFLLLFNAAGLSVAGNSNFIVYWDLVQSKWPLTAVVHLFNSLMQALIKSKSAVWQANMADVSFTWISTTSIWRKKIINMNIKTWQYNITNSFEGIFNSHDIKCHPTKCFILKYLPLNY